MSFTEYGCSAFVLSQERVLKSLNSVDEKEMKKIRVGLKALLRI